VALGADLVVPSSDELCSNDIALIHLDRVVSGVKPLAVGLDNQPPTGSYVRAVGFGKRSQKTGAGKKYARDHVRVLDRSAAEFIVGEATCNGDSGGPALDASGAIVGVVSRGGPGCTGADATNVYTRTSAFARLIKRALSH
jgi:S1-C subfamily serine protease